YFFFLYIFAIHPALHSFPTRRSSDLAPDGLRPDDVVAAQVAERPPSLLTPRAPNGSAARQGPAVGQGAAAHERHQRAAVRAHGPDRKSTRLNSSHQIISYAVFCLKKK